MKVASLLTGIPEGSISHYYARFNRNPEKYQKMANNPHNDPPYSSPSDVAIALFNRNEILSHVVSLVQQGDYSKARDYLQVMLLTHDLIKRMDPTIKNCNPKEKMEIMRFLVKLYSMKQK